MDKKTNLTVYPNKTAQRQSRVLKQIQIPQCDSSPAQEKRQRHSSKAAQALPDKQSCFQPNQPVGPPPTSLLPASCVGQSTCIDGDNAPLSPLPEFLGSSLSLDSQLSCDDMILLRSEFSERELSEPPCIVSCPDQVPGVAAMAVTAMTSSAARMASLAARRGRLQPTPVCVTSELMLDEAASPRQQPLEEAKDPNLAAAHQPQGWFLKCRGCAQLTGGTFMIQQQNIPCCCACLQKLFLMPKLQRRPCKEQLVAIHVAWTRSGH